MAFAGDQMCFMLLEKLLKIFEQTVTILTFMIHYLQCMDKIQRQKRI